MADEAHTTGGIAGPGGRAEPSPAQPVLPQLDGVGHRFVDLPGLRMHVAEAGRGEPLVLLHGFPQHWWEWRNVIPGLAEHYRVICPDLRGAGWTDAPRKGYNRDQLLADVVALLDALELDRVRLIAHDWAAIVGFDLCLRHPDRVQHYLALSVPHPFIRFDLRIFTSWWRVLWLEPVVASPLVGPSLLGKGRQRFARFLLRYTAVQKDVWSDEVLEHFVAPLRQPARARAGAAIYRTFIVPSVVRILTGVFRRMRLRTPTRLLFGAQDPVYVPKLLGGHERYADDLTLEAVDGASHFVADEKPDAVVERALEFFARP